MDGGSHVVEDGESFVRRGDAGESEGGTSQAGKAGDAAAGIAPDQAH